MRVWVTIVSLGLIIAAAAQAQVLRTARPVDSVDTRLLFVGADPARGAPGEIPKTLQTYAIPDLPAETSARGNALATLLRATPVSTLVTDPDAKKPRPDQFFLVSDMVLSFEGKVARISTGDASFSLDELPGRLAATVDAFNPSRRAVAFLSIADRDDRFPAMVPTLQTTLAQSRFDMIVVAVATGPDAAACLPRPEVATHYAVIGGVADQGQFGDKDGQSDAQEVGLFLNRTLARQAELRRDCGQVYALIVKAEENPEAVIAVHTAESEFRELEATLYHETFESRFLLESDDEDKLAIYLRDCTYCPNEGALADRLSGMRALEQTRQLEAEIWQTIRADEEPTRIAIYLEDCSVCAYRSDAEDRIAILRLQAEKREAEGVAFRAARESMQLAALRDYAGTCIACDFKDEAQALITRIETDTAHKDESARLAAAIDRSDSAGVRDYLQTCTVCAARAQAEAVLDHLSRLAEAAAPCIQMAGMPQEGGPRLLSEIDTSRARAACSSALRAFPGEAGLTVRLGRVAQAEGDGAAAMKAYEYGVGAGLPAAYGLAAFVRYNGSDGQPVDIEAAADLARQGAAEGDWLSREVLTVLYSKDLVRGHDAAEAFTIAAALAEEGNLVAQFFTGYFYLTGTGTAASEADAEFWLTRAADAGYGHAMAYLAGLYETGSAAIASPERAADIYLAGLKAGEPTVTDRMTTQIRDRARPVLRIVQERLKDEGVYTGSIDGLPGPGTQAAIRKFMDGAGAG
jgi:TPR repeat protein